LKNISGTENKHDWKRHWRWIRHSGHCC